MFGSSMSLTPPRCALRAARFGPAIRLSKFVPDEFVEPLCVRPRTLPPNYKKSPFRGSFL